jgi:hypothetical protein
MRCTSQLSPITSPSYSRYWCRSPVPQPDKRAPSLAMRGPTNLFIQIPGRRAALLHILAVDQRLP